MIKISNLLYYKILILLTTTNLSQTYQIFSLDDDKLCSPTKRTIALGPNSLSGLVISLNNASKLSRHKTEWRSDFTCHFNIDALNISSGLFAVIQNVAFRKNEQTNECIDYVEYRRHDGSASRRYCGQPGIDSISDIDAINLAPTVNSFVEPGGVLDVYVYIAKRPLKPYRKIELEIVFTSFRYCYRNFSKDDRPCSTKYMAHCIYKNFFNDGLVNCPYPGCVDEKHCPRKIYYEYKKPTSLGVAISLFAMLIAVFAFFLCYICRKRKKFCWADGFSITRERCHCPQTVEMNEAAVRDRSLPHAYTISPSVPTVSSLEERETLPPSYDSLFPSKQL